MASTTGQTGQARLIGMPLNILPALKRRQQHRHHLTQPTCNSILLMERRESDAVRVKDVLRSAGIALPIRIAEDVAAVKAYLQGTGAFSDRSRYPLPSILMLPARLPKKGGFEVLRWLRAQPHFRHILVAVFADPRRVGDIGQAFRLGADWLLTRRCSVADIRNLVQTFPAYWSSSTMNETQSGGEP